MKLTLFYHNITVIDYSFLDYKLGPVGNSLIVDLELEGTNDSEEGVIFDFAIAKKKVKEIIDQECDHRLIVPTDMIGLTMEEFDGAIHIHYPFGGDLIPLAYRAPTEAICQIECEEITTGALSSFLQDTIMAQMPANIVRVGISLRQEVGSRDDSFFHYTHGLKKHYGNCQRLLHGHRNTIFIAIDGKRSIEHERKLLSTWPNQAIHFACWDNILNQGEITSALKDGESPLGHHPAAPLIHVAYQSKQGQFELKLPANMIYILPCETTIENISSYFAKLIREQVGSEHLIQLFAFEGVGKGASTTLPPGKEDEASLFPA
jgi:6-pyruvoyl-tetrahydropterin synthase